MGWKREYECGALSRKEKEREREKERVREREREKDRERFSQIVIKTLYVLIFVKRIII